MAVELRHIERIYDTEANVRANLDAAQSAILTDVNEEWVYCNHDDTRLYYQSNQYYWNGAAVVYCDTEHDDVYAHGDLYVGRYLFRDADLDTYLDFTSDAIDFYCGGVQILVLAEDVQDTAVFNPTGGDVDFTVNTAVNTALAIEGATGDIRINSDQKDCDLTVLWDGGTSLFVRGSDGVVDIGGTAAPTWKTATYDVLVIGDNTAWAVLPDSGGFGHSAELVANAYYDITDSRWEYGDAGAYASRYTIDGCDSTQYHTWHISTMGASAGDAITWKEVMQIEGNGSAGALVINEDAIDFDVRIESVAGPYPVGYTFFVQGSDGKVAVWGASPLAAVLTIYQYDAIGESCLSLSQADVSEGFIDFVGSDRGVVAIPSCSDASVRVEINGTVKLIPLLADA
jgi:hypothetical protein